VGIRYAKHETANEGTPAYLVASWEILQADRLEPFSEAVVPLAEKAGFEMLAAFPPQVLEGTWPERSTVIVQKYGSMDELLNFWRSAEHAEVKRLREGIIDSHFVIAVEAVR
jgi:uncharacterized protein (DUF1330 family)